MAKKATEPETQRICAADVPKDKRVKVTIVTRITGTITSVQTAGCTHAITRRVNGQPVHSTTHGVSPCPDRDKPIGIMVQPDGEGPARGQWLYLTGVPGRTVQITPAADRD